jgi:hypothetical protein
MPHIKSSFSSPDVSYSKAVLLIVQLALWFGGSTPTQAGERGSFAAALQAGLNDQLESLVGYLMVYSATDRFDDGGTLYYAHRSYSIYTTHGKLFKNVENHISRSDEIPTLVALPAGAYTVEMQSEIRGYVRVPIVIIPDRETVLDLDKDRTDIGKRLTHTKHSPRLAG